MSGARATLVLAAGLLIGAAASGTGPGASDEKLRQLMQQLRPQSTASQQGRSALRESGSLPAERLDERTTLLRTGEAALARLDTPTALRDFDRAALILHAADTEIALVRSYMQAGEYRRALAFGAHTAGAHLDVIGGAALYAWLLDAGGQRAIAQRLLSDASVRMPDNAMLAQVRTQLESGAPRASGPLLTPPTRLAPFGQSRGIPANAQVLGSGLLLAGGTHALIPLALLPRSGRIWLRNGLGQLSTARLDRRLTGSGTALMRLASPLPAADDLSMAARDAFPGSAAYAVAFVATPDAAPAWPVLRTGFLGSATGKHRERLLGIALPAGPRGGPVFDGTGRLIGLALPASSATGGHIEGRTPRADRLVLVSALQSELRSLSAKKNSLRRPPALGPPAPADPPRPLAVDRVYESGLKSTLQVIGAR